MNANKKMMARIEEIVRNPEQPRTFFDAEKLALLGKSLARRQQQPLTVIPFRDPKRPKVRWMINDGERRFRAAQKAGMKELWIVVDDVAHGDDLHTASFAANWNRAGHTHAETAAAIDRERKTGKTYEEIGDIVGKSHQWARNEHVLLQLTPEFLALMDPPTPPDQRMPMKVALLLAGYPPEKQMKLWLKYRSRPDAFHHIRVAAPARGVRDSTEDARYIERQARKAVAVCKQIVGLPASMIQRISAEKRKGIVAGLRELSRSALETAALVEAAGGNGSEIDDEE